MATGFRGAIFDVDGVLVAGSNRNALPGKAEPGGRQARTPCVPRRADLRDARSGGRSPLARSVT